MSKQQWLAGLGAGSLMVAGVIAADPYGGAAQRDGALQGDEAQAAEIAVKAYPGAEVREIESEKEGGRLLWEVELSNGVEVEIDLTTAEIVDSEQGDDGEDGDDGDTGTVARFRSRFASFLPFGNSETAVQDQQEDEREGAEQAITGSVLDRASAAAREYLGDGRVTDTEVGDEEGYYEVEVTLANGSQVDVHLDEDFNVLGEEADSGEDGDEDEALTEDELAA
jgi:uncharacterized membrane protein YkoI